jgi:acetyl-CoA carboxylase biotin carboxyl carrier protein
MEKVAAHVTGTVAKVEKRTGERVAAGEVVVVLESMKMEMLVEAVTGGTVREVRCAEGQAVAEGDVLLIID